MGAGSTEFSFGLGDLGIIQLPDIAVETTFGNATLVTAIPEPSSAIVLILGSVAVLARRKRV